MKNITLLFVVFFLIVGCTKSDSNDTVKEPQVNLPKITTTVISEITQTSAISGGTISDDGGANITARGVCWSIMSNPSINDSKTSGGTSKGEFNSSVTSLEANTNYFLRSYATNSEGTAYGNEISFTTLEPEPVTKIFEGNVTLFTQQEVNEFGAKGYVEIIGNLTIGIHLPISSSDITDLRPLENLQKTEKLFIGNVSALSNLDGLENLEEVDNIFIKNNIVLENIDALNSLIRITSSFNLEQNDLIESVNGFKNLLFSGYIAISNNTSLKEINGFENLTNTDGIIVRDNPNLEKIIGFNALLSIGYNLNIEDNLILKEINGFSKVKTIGLLNPSDPASRGVIISHNSMLETVLGFDVLTNTLQIQIINNTKLEVIDGFYNITDLEYLNIYNTSLSTFYGFNKLERLGNMQFILNPYVENLDNFESLKSITKISIAGNNQLQNINVFKKVNHSLITSIGIVNNEVLTTLEGLSGITNVSESIQVANNPLIMSLLGLEKLENVGGSLSLQRNEALTNLISLGNLKSVENLSIVENGNLSNLDGLNNLNSIGTALKISDNLSLTSLEGLNHLSNCGQIRILDNTNLSDFCGLDILFNGTWNNSLWINGNLFDPNSEQIRNGICTN